jgi:hypothetical protein
MDACVKTHDGYGLFLHLCANNSQGGLPSQIVRWEKGAEQFKPRFIQLRFEEKIAEPFTP